ncbi:MAG: hypothetical protein HN589_06605 [Proteobacteria bacterium]|nr:hypothetical protein [Pseudomonadota bacterium]
MLDLLVGAWVFVGFCGAVWMQVTEDSSMGLFEFAFFVVLGPLILLWVGISALFGSNEVKTSTRPTSAPPKTDEELIEEFDVLLVLLEETFGSDIEEGALTKTDFVKLQRLSTLSSKLIIKSRIMENGILDQVCAILENGLDYLDEVYGSNNSAGRSKRNNISKALKKLGKKSPGQSPKPAAETDASGRFGLPFDVDELLKAFPASESWSVNEDYPGEEWMLLRNAQGESLGFSVKTISDFDSFDEHVEYVKDLGSEVDLTSDEDLDNRQSSNLRIFLREVSTEDEGYSGFAKIEGPASQVGYVTWEGDSPQLEVFNERLKNFPWLPFNTSPALEFTSKRQWKQYIRQNLDKKTVATLFDDEKEIASELLQQLDDDYMSPRDMAVLARTPELSSLYRGLARWMLAQGEDFDMWNKLDYIDHCGPNGVDDVELGQAIISSQFANADNFTTGECIEFLELLNKDLGALNEGNEQLIPVLHQMAITQVRDISDLTTIAGSALFAQSDFIELMKKYREQKHDEDFSSYYTPIELFSLGYIRGFIDESDLVKEIHSLSDPKEVNMFSSLELLKEADKYSDPESCHWFLKVTIENKDIAEIFTREKFSIQFLNLARSSKDKDEIVELHEYLLEDREDPELAASILEQNHDVITTAKAEEEAAEKSRELLNSMCQCALLVSAGDGTISQEEIGEVGEVKAFLGMLIRNREAIEALDQSGDIEQAKELRGDMVLMHEMDLFTPSYLRNTMDDINETESAEDILALFPLYAANVSGEFERRIALWAAKEVAQIDGLEEGEIISLNVLAKEWGLDVKENEQYFKDVVYPAIDDKFEYTGRSDGRSLLDFARAADKEKEQNELVGGAEEEADIFQSLLQELGCDSFEQLARVLGDNEDSVETVEDTERPWPPIFEDLFTDGGWSSVRDHIKAGADVNETINLHGVEGLSILTICAEQGDVETMKLLVEAGADINARQKNIELASGYNSPLVASLKGGNMGHFDYLIECGADVDPFQDKESGWTPLVQAAHHVNNAAIKTLLERGADVNIANADSANAFKTVCHHTTAAARKCMRTLIKAGADTSRADNEGYAGIHNVAASQSSGNFLTLKLLVEEGQVDVDLPLRPAVGADTPLKKALVYGNSESADYLLAQGASASSSNKFGTSIFRHIFDGATSEGLEDPIGWLKKVLAKGARPTIEDVISLFALISNNDIDDESDLWLVASTERLLSEINPEDVDLEDIDSEELGEEVEGSYDSAPEITQAIIDKIEVFGIDVHDLID